MNVNNFKIDKVSEHTVKKIELISSYVMKWSHILMESGFCNELVYIDCMSNCGEYYHNGNIIEGTAIKVFNILNDVAKSYPNIKIKILFNDIDSNKIEYLKEKINNPYQNISVKFFNLDAIDFLEKIRGITKLRNTHYLLVYDPYDATIDWDVIEPYINSWGEVIINHMVSDSIRAVKMAKSTKAKTKYEMAYRQNIEDIIPYGSDKQAYEKRINEIITNQLSTKPQYYVCSFPFFNKNNSIMYDLIHCTSNLRGFTTFKSCAWKVFDGHSSNKKNNKNNQILINFENDNIKFNEDAYCFNVLNIAEYLYEHYKGESYVKLNDMWNHLEMHPVFPTDCYKNEIKNSLVDIYGVKKKKGGLDFSGE